MYRFLEVVANVLLGGKGSLDRLARAKKLDTTISLVLSIERAG